jgi:hypothetical protein
MNAKHVLSRIASILNLSDDASIQAKTEDGTILQSANFDVNDDVFEVGADGKLTPAADGEYTITFTTPEGEDSTQVIDVDGGKIAEISTPNEEAQEKEGVPEESEEEMDETTPVTEMSDEKKGAATTEEAHSLPNTTDEDPRNSVGNDTDDEKDPVIALSARVAQLEDALSAITEKFNSAFPSEGQEVSSLTPTPTMMSEEEEELPKLDGAPVEQKFSLAGKLNENKKAKDGDYQNSFLSKLYK